MRSKKQELGGRNDWKVTVPLTEYVFDFIFGQGNSHIPVETQTRCVESANKNLVLTCENLQVLLEITGNAEGRAQATLTLKNIKCAGGARKPSQNSQRSCKKVRGARASQG